MIIINKKTPLKKLKQLTQPNFGGLVKAVVDIEKEILIIGGDLHADEEALLLNQGSKQENLWGINLYPKITGSKWIEFDSMINLRPSQGNNSRGVDSPKTKKDIIKVVSRLICK